MKSPKPQTGVIEKLLYRRQEAAFALGMSIRAIDYMIANGVLSTRRVGRCVVIPAADVRRAAERILQSDMVDGAASPDSKPTKAKGRKES